MISADELREKQFKDYEKEIVQEQQIIRISDELITDPHFLSDVDALVEKRLDKQVTDAMAWRKSFIRVDNLGLEKINADVIAHWKIKLRNKGYVVKPSTEIEWR